MLLVFVRLLTPLAFLCVVHFDRATGSLTCINKTVGSTGPNEIESCKTEDTSCWGSLARNSSASALQSDDSSLIMWEGGCGCKTAIMGNVTVGCEKLSIPYSEGPDTVLSKVPYSEVIYCCCEGEQCNTEANLKEKDSKSNELATTPCPTNVPLGTDSAQTSALSQLASAIVALALLFNVCFINVGFGID